MASQVITDINHSKILLVDDKDDSLMAIEALLEDEGHTFVKAYSAKEALKILLNDQDFSLILMDVNMPEINGFETAELIYKREKLTHIPIIFITAYDAGYENSFAGYQCGGIDYISKPINPELLKIKVKVFIELFRKNRQLIQKEKELKEANDALQAQIREKTMVEDELRFRNIQLSEAQKLARVGSWEWNILTDSIEASEEIYNIFNLNPQHQNIKLENLLTGIHPADRKHFEKEFAGSITEGKSFNLFFRTLENDGELKFHNIKGRPVTNNNNEVIKFYGTGQDITEINRTKEQLKILTLLEKMLNEIYVFNEDDLRLAFANEDAVRNLGFSADELKKMKFSDLLSGTDEKVLRDKTAVLLEEKQDKIIRFDQLKRKDGTLYPVEIHIQLVDTGASDGSASGFSQRVFLAVVLDLTERQRTELKLVASLKEKEILLKEIHHRVKNNLQIISSLLNLQRNSAKNTDVNSLINECTSRIRSMSMLHEKLYRSEDLGSINFVSYVQELGDFLITTYRGRNKNIGLRIDSHVPSVTMDTGISLGLILNELISNSIKHGLKHKNNGEIGIELHRSEEDYLCLRVKDNGTGFPENFDFENVQSLGMLLVDSLVSQLNGKLHIHSNAGAVFEIQFPAPPAR